MKKAFFVIAILVSLFSCDNGLDLGDGYVLEPTAIDSRAILKDKTSQYAVYGHVIDYTHDDKFILALQVPQDSIMDFPDFIHMSWKEKDYLCEYREGKQYYIIDKKNDSTYGPLDRKQYFVVRSILDVSNSSRSKIER